MAEDYGPLGVLPYREGVSAPLRHLSDKYASDRMMERTPTNGELRRTPGWRDKLLAAALTPAYMATGMFNSLADIPKNFYELRDQYNDTGEMDIGKTLNLASLGVGGGAVAPVSRAAGETVLGAGPVLRPLSQASPLIAAGDTRVSTRFPTAVRSTENPLTHHLSIGVDEMRMDPNAFAHNTSILSRYPGFAHLKGMSADDAAKAYMQQAADNMRYLYENSPAEMRLRSPRWYEGAHEISDALSNRWGIPRQSSSAALASLSPLTDWFVNASLGERTGDIVMANPRATSDMVNWIKSQPGLMKKGFVGDALKEMQTQKGFRRFDQLSQEAKPVFIRAYDEAHNPSNYRTILPEGYFGDWVRKQSGDPQKVSWGFFNDIDKAVRSIESGGDMNTLSALLGNKHKVRSFYNNIETPYDTRFGDVTGDTHQVAAGQMRPLSGSSEAVIQHLGSGGPAGSVNPKSSDVTGVQGTYGLINDATKDFARDAGLLPRAGQSATWEPVRELFPADWKTPTNAAAVDDIWRKVDSGELTAAQARDAIFKFAGGIGLPEWAKPGVTAVAPQLGSTYR